MTVLKTKSGSSFVKFINVAGGIPREGMVNDSVIDMGIKMIADSVKGCVALSSLMMWPSALKQWLSETPLVILPLHLSRIHWCVIIVENWHAESGAKERFPKEIVKKWINELVQPDGTSCGLMILGMIYAFVRNAHRFKRHRVTEAYMRVMRLRITWLLLCITKRVQPSAEIITEMLKTDEEISRLLDKQ
ncbi:hypothetical protein GQ600_17227 [Phytophthora cactorum]|nr:hypothetical protein GQ600_17227 [Phytophthora cactorum]